MADISDVTSALVSLIASVVYPNGTTQPSVAGVAVKVFEGWPVPQQLDSDLAAGAAQVSVYPRVGEEATTRYLNDGEAVLSISAAKITATIASQSITLGGTIPAAGDTHVVVILVNGKPYTYQVLSTDTLSGIASALAALIAADVSGCSATGAVINVPAPARLGAARLATTGQYARELRRQRRPIQITVWAPNPAVRNALASAIDVTLADTRFLSLPDQKARLLYQSSPVADGAQKTNLYRRDLIYTVDFGTTAIKTTTTVATEVTNVSVQSQDPSLAPTATFTTNI